LHEFLPGGPERRQARHEDEHREQHADACTPSRRPADRQRDQQVDGRVLEEVDAVGKQRDRADPDGDRELDAEIGEVEKCDRNDGAAKGLTFEIQPADLLVRLSLFEHIPDPIEIFDEVACTLVMLLRI
jgi:hypothetical protein